MIKVLCVCLPWSVLQGVLFRSSCSLGVHVCLWLIVDSHPAAEPNPLKEKSSIAFFYSGEPALQEWKEEGDAPPQNYAQTCNGPDPLRGVRGAAGLACVAARTRMHRARLNLSQCCVCVCVLCGCVCVCVCVTFKFVRFQPKIHWEGRL